MLLSRCTFCVRCTTMHQFTVSLYLKQHTLGACVFSCNLLPARDLLRATTVTCGLQLSDVTRGGTDTDIRVSTESWPPRRKFSCRSSRESNSRPFDRESVESQVPVTTQPRWLCNSLRKWLRNNAKTNNQTTWRKNKKQTKKQNKKREGERETDRQREKGRKNKPEGSGQCWSEHQPNLQSPLFCFKTKLFTKQQMNSGEVARQEIPLKDWAVQGLITLYIREERQSQQAAW